MTVQEIMKELENYGDERTKQIFLKHGAREPYFGVKVQDLKKIVKKVKKDHTLSIGLYNTGNSDAMYLAGLIADENKISREELNRWVKNASWYMIREYTVPWVASESAYGFDLGLEWIDSDDEGIASAGWSTLSSVAGLVPDDQLDIKAYKKLLKRVEMSIHKSPNRVRYTMNGFVITVGTAIVKLSDEAKRVAESIGKIDVEMGGTSCKVPLATAYIKKVIDRGTLGKKRKSARC